MRPVGVGVEGAIKNITMYGRFIKETSLLDVRAIFERLQGRSRGASFCVGAVRCMNLKPFGARRWNSGRCGHPCEQWLTGAA
jgi:hypothetical protein